MYKGHEILYLTINSYTIKEIGYYLKENDVAYKDVFTTSSKISCNTIMCITTYFVLNISGRLPTISCANDSYSHSPAPKIPFNSKVIMKACL